MRANRESGHEKAPWYEAGRNGLQHQPFGVRGEEDHHVARQDHQVESTGTRGKVGKICVKPRQIWSLGAGRVEHAAVSIHTNDGKTAPGQLDGHPPRAAARVEHTGSAGLTKQLLDQIRFAVHVVADRGQVSPSLVVVVTAGCADSLPTRAHPVMAQRMPPTTARPAIRITVASTGGK